MKIISANISCDIGSSIWVADVEVSDKSAFSSIKITDLVNLSLLNTNFIMIVDGKLVSRTSEVETEFQLKLKSPLALYDDPYCSSITVSYPLGEFAKKIVEDMIGTNSWELPNWMINSLVSTFVDSTPLKIAQLIVGSVGGIIISEIDGSVRCVNEFKENISNYSSAIPSLVLGDNSVINMQETKYSFQIYNRFLISNSLSGSSEKDSIEYVQKTDSNGIMYGYPFDWRVPSLVHTGDPNTVISSIGLVFWVSEEEIEIIDGNGKVSHKIDSILSYEWNMINLGTISFNGDQVSTSVSGCSLLKIKYYVKAYQWNVSCPDNNSVQFLLL